MRKFILMALAGTAIALAAPEFASATPLSLGSGLGAAADNVSITSRCGIAAGIGSPLAPSSPFASPPLERPPLLVTALRERTAGACAGRFVLARLTARPAPRKSPRMAVREIIILPDKRLRLVSEAGENRGRGGARAGR